MQVKFWDKTDAIEDSVFQAAFECAPIGMAIVSLQGKVLKVNRSFCSLLGNSKEELLGARLDDLLYTNQDEQGRDRLGELIGKGMEISRHEIEYLDKLGKRVWLMVNAAVVATEDEAPKHLILQVEDITERKEAEAALRESEAKFRSYIEQSIDGVHVIDKHGHYIEVNPAGAAMFGYSEEELLKLKIGDIIAPGESDGFDHFKNLVHTGESKGEITARSKTGEQIIIEVNAVALGDNRFMGLVRDVTARKNAEEMLLASEERFRSAFHYAPIGMTLVTLDGSFIKVNGSLCEILGYTEDELLSLNFKEITHPEDLNANIDYQQRLLKGEIRNYSTQKRYIHKSGKLVYTLLSATVVRDNTGNPLYFVSQIYDISEQRKAVEALVEREQMYRTLFEKAANPILVIDKEGNYIDCNEEATRFFECERSKILSHKDNDDTLRPRVDMFEHYKSLREKGSSIESSYMINGSAKVLDLTVTPVLWRGQEALIGIGRDITEQKEHEKILRQSEERYRRLVEYFPDTISIVNNGKVVYINKAGAILLEVPQKDGIVGRAITDFIHPDYISVVQSRINAVESGSAAGLTEAKFISSENKMIDVEVTVIPFTYKGRSMVQLVIEDITKNKQTEGALATEKQRLAVTLHSIGEGVITADSEGTIVLANDVAGDLTGWKKEDMIGRHLHEVVTVLQEKTGTKCLDAGTKVLESGKQSLIPEAKILVALDGTEKIIEDSATPVFSQEGDIIGAVFVFRDISEQRKMEEEFLKVEKLESLGILAGGLAHDFNNILTVILGNIALARLILPENQEVDELLEETEEATVRARDLTKQLLTFAKGGAPILQTTSVNDLIRHTASFALRGSNVKGEINIPKDLWTVEVDEGQISQVINNLIINANQAMPDGGILKLKAENTTIGEGSFIPLEGNYVKITVEDNGIGISESNLARIFDPYFTTKQKGSGLGLATAFSVVKKHRGHIAVESELGRGTKFFVYLPASTKKVTAQKPLSLVPLKGSGRILLMDDEGAVRYTAQKILSRCGYEVIEAIDGEEAIELFKLAQESGKPYDVVIMDLTVPGGMGGKETIEALLTIEPEVKAIVSSGYSNDPIMANYKEYGFAGVVAKPYKIGELTALIHNVLQ